MAVPTRVVIVQSADLALGLVDLTAYSTGFSLRLALRLHPDTEFDPRGMMMQLHGGEGLRFGIEFADGRRATSMRGPRRPPDEAPDIHLTPRGAGGGGGSYDLGFWVYPLPPPGAIVVAAEWPGRFSETRYELDAVPIIEAAAGSEQLWPGDGTVGGGVSMSWGISRLRREEPPAPDR